jgi:hypothetical protein
MKLTFHAITIVVLLAASEVFAAQLINGDFETGDLTGWTTFYTPQGGTSGPRIDFFDTTGLGGSLCAEFEVGQVMGDPGPGKPGEGAGILQDVFLNDGQLTINLNIAAWSPIPNQDAGKFELLLDGQVVDSFNFGLINAQQTLRSTLSYAGMITSGVHEIAIDMRRNATGAGSGYTPFQFLDNIILGGPAVPEPSVLGLAGLAVLAVLALKRRARRMAK